MKEKILELIENRHKSSNGKCGIYLVEVLRELNVTLNQVKPILSEIHKNKEIRVRKGLNGYLLMKKL